MHRRLIDLPPNHPDCLSPSHPKIAGFEEALSELRRNMQDDIKSVCKTGLPYRVETRIVRRRNMADSTGVMAGYVDLKAADEEYCLTERKQKFETM